MATGMAIMGFGGGAMVGAPLAAALMNHFASPEGVGVWQSFVVMAVIYFVFMIGGALSYRVPPTGWKPEGWTAPVKKASNSMITNRHVHVSVAWKTPQFRLVWLVLCLNVSAGIGILGMASPLLQEVFAGKLLGLDLAFNQLDAAQLASIAAFCVILSMYGGGFATVPAYLADLFGTQMVGAIHGRLLTAWAAAGILGPVLVNYLREYQLSHGVARADAYDITLYILSGLLVLGFICNLLVRPVADKYFMTEEELAIEQSYGMDKGADHTTVLEWKANPASKPLVIAAWLAVGIPLAWGVWITLQKTAVLFH
jgi:MFS family permease